MNHNDDTLRAHQFERLRNRGEQDLILRGLEWSPSSMERKIINDSDDMDFNIKYIRGMVEIMKTIQRENMDLNPQGVRSSLQHQSEAEMPGNGALSLPHTHSFHNLERRQTTMRGEGVCEGAHGPELAVDGGD